MTAEALLAGALALVVFFGVRWVRDFLRRMNGLPVEEDVHDENP